MRRVGRSAILNGALAATLLSLSVLNAQQKSKDVPAAPVPAQITDAKKIFVSYAGQENNLRAGSFGEYSGGPSRTYNQFYAAMKNWGRYELAAAPADCDLVFEIRFTDAMAGASVFKGDTMGAADEPKFRLVILDPKTHIVLWVFTEHVESAHLQGNRDKNFDKALAKIVDDAKGLVAPPVAAATNAQ